ncbi:MAG: hypothetical protein HKN56_07630 [Gammaproteobacteria bacterium]|nr:hypothetical protein [Gammaproteobacteria bacterium]
MVAAADYPPPTAHDPLIEVFPDVFLVRGSYRASAWFRFNRNMVVVRDGDELTVINSVRLQPQFEPELDRLGTVRHVVRLAYFHGQDDRYYVDRYGAELWAAAGSRREPGPAATRVLTTGGPLPFSAADVYVTAHSKHPEAVIRLQREGGILLTCDSLQYYTDRRFGSLAARIMMPFMGFPLRMLIGPLWLKAMTPEGGSLLPDFEYIAGLPFRHLIPGHGSVCRDDAHRKVQDAVAAVWPAYQPAND